MRLWPISSEQSQLCIPYLNFRTSCVESADLFVLVTTTTDKGDDRYKHIKLAKDQSEQSELIKHMFVL